MCQKLLSSRKLLTISASFQIPQSIRKSLQLTIDCNVQPKPTYQPKSPSVLSTNLIKSYFEKGLIDEARTLFDEMPGRDVVSWTAMIAGYASCNLHPRAWTLFCDLIREGTDYPNEFTLSSALKACKGIKSLTCGVLAHGLALKHGLIGYIYVDNALLDMYATCGIRMDCACSVFGDIHDKNAVSWTTLITGYTHRGDAYGGLQVFRQMLMEDAEPNPYSYSIAVRACTSVGSYLYGQQIHAAVIKLRFESNITVMNSILDMYCRCSCLSEANRCFYGMIQRNSITWNTLIAGYEKSNSSESLYVFSQMELDGSSPDCFTFTSVIAACANLAVLNCGQQIHGAIFRRGFNEAMGVGNALISMYAKCGSIMDSCKIFVEMSSRDLVSWTSMMIAYGSHGYGRETVELFNTMVNTGIKPDHIVFMAVLSACSHARLVEEGLKCFTAMVGHYNITPSQEIYGCVVDLLGRAGRIDDAFELMERMPFQPDESIWSAFLGAFKANRVPDIDKLALRRILDSRPNMPGTYLMLSNIYAANGKWGEFAKIRKLLKGMENKKEAGRSWVEVRNQVCSFVVGDKVGSHVESVYDVLKILVQHMKGVEYASDLNCLLHDVENGTLA